MYKIRKIKDSNVAGVNLSGVGIFVNQSIDNKKNETQTQSTLSTKIYAIGAVKGWTMFWVIISSVLSVAAIICCIVSFPREESALNKNFDYIGLIVGILALLVTFLVSWQIYSTIKAKDELKETQKEIKDNFETRLQDLENKMEKLNNKQSKTDGIEEAKEQIDKAIDLAFPKDVLERVHLDIAKKGTKLYEWLWSIIDDVKTNGQILDDYAKALKKCRKRVLYINGREATESEVLELANEIRPIKLMILGAIKK